MKHLLFSALLIFLSLVSSAQYTIDSLVSPSDSVHQDFTNKMNSFFGDLDPTYIPSGNLYDRGIPYLNIAPFDGTISSTNKSSLFTFQLAYATLYTMDIVGNLPEPDDYKEKMLGQGNLSEIVLITGLHQEYHKIDLNAVNNNLLMVENGKMLDVLPRSQSPYMQHELFMLAPATQKVKRLNFSMVISGDLFYSNTAKTIQSINIDLADGAGFRACQIDSPVNCKYEEGGLKTIYVVIQYTDGTNYGSHFDLFVENNIIAKDGDDSWNNFHYIPPILTGISEEGRGGGKIYVYYACGHEKIEKPFIWAEAFNPAIGNLNFGLTPEMLIARMKMPETQVISGSSKTLWDYLIDEGYDIVLLDYDHGADYLPRTAEFIKEAIRWVNEQKDLAGSNEKNIIIGQSMGGVATNRALKEMELDGEDHEVGTFIVFDSPIMGVNVPLCAQASLIDIATLPVNHPFQGGGYKPLYEFIPMLEDAANLLFLPATRTMTRYMINDIPPAWRLWEDYYEYQHQTLNGGPTQCEVLTITNGSHAGVDGQQPFGAGELILQSHINNFTVYSALGGFLQNGIESGDPLLVQDAATAVVGFIAAWESGLEMFIDIRFYSVPDHTAGDVYISNIYLNSPWAEAFNGGQPVVMNSTIRSVSNMPPIDNAPGGFFGIGNQGVILDNLPLGALAPPVFKMQTYCFTPTFSVLNYHSNPGNNEYLEVMKDFEDNESEISSLNTRNVDNFVANSETPDFGTSVSYNNTAHTWFTQENTKFVLYHLIGDVLGPDELAIAPVINSYNYNFGKAALSAATNFESGVPRMTRSVLDVSVTVDHQILGINRSTQIGKSIPPAATGNTLPNSSFLLTIGDVCEDESIVLTIQNGAQFILGDNLGRIGACHVNASNEVIIKSGSSLIINEGSTFKLKAHAKLTVENGAEIIIRNNAKLITETGSEIIYHDGAEIHLLGEGAVLDMAGTLNLMENAQFFPKHEGVESGQIIVRSPLGWLVTEDNAQVILFGDGSNDLFLNVENSGEIIVPANMLNFVISNCKVLDNDINNLNTIRSFAPFYATGVNFELGNLPLAYHEHAILHANNFARLINCNLLNYRIVGSFSAGGWLEIFTSEMNLTFHQSLPLVDVNHGGYKMNNNSFKGYTFIGVKSTGLVLPSYISNSDFTGAELSTSQAIRDISNVDLKLNANSFYKHYTAVSKTGGTLTMRCNVIDEAVFSAVDVLGNCWLKAGIYDHAGYNVFTNVYGYNLHLANAQYISISHGYNSFDNEPTGSYIIYGSVQIASGDKQYINAKKNLWVGASPFPNPSDINIWSSLTGNNIPLQMQEPQNAMCGANDPPKPTPIGPGSLQGGQKIYTSSFSGEKIIDAVQFTVNGSEIRDTFQNDLIALGLFKEILTYNITSPNMHTRWLQMYSLEFMTQTVYNTFLTGKITREGNLPFFHEGVQDYVDVLNYRSMAPVDSENYLERFEIEMNKAHLFYILGNTNLSLEFLYNMESCGLDYNEQQIVNTWKYLWETDLAKLGYGSDADLIDTVWVDSTAYLTPVHQQPGNFGSTITGRNSVQFVNCSAPKTALHQNNEELVFNLFPNPSNGQINFEYALNEEQSGHVLITTIDSKELQNFICSPGTNYGSIDISHVPSGTYFYYFTINGVVESAGKFVIVH